MSLDVMRQVDRRAWDAVQDGEDSWWTRPSAARTVLLGLAYFVNGESRIAYPSVAAPARNPAAPALKAAAPARNPARAAADQERTGEEDQEKIRRDARARGPDPEDE